MSYDFEHLNSIKTPRQYEVSISIGIFQFTIDSNFDLFPDFGSNEAERFYFDWLFFHFVIYR